MFVRLAFCKYTVCGRKDIKNALWSITTKGHKGYKITNFIKSSLSKGSLREEILTQLSTMKINEFIEETKHKNTKNLILALLFL